MKEIREIRTARKKYTCTEASWHIIKSGEKYLYASCPPWHDANSTKKWWIIRACLVCADKYGLHNSETRKQLKTIE
jgi:hypothetical protein